MARKPTGSIRQTASGFEVRITIDGNRRIALPLGPRDEDAARERGALVAGYADRLRRAGMLGSETARDLLRRLAVTMGRGHASAVQLAEEILAGRSRLPGAAKAAPTFRQVADDWTSGRLHKRFPDHVRAKKNASTDEARVAHLCGIAFDGVALGDVPIDSFTIEHAEHAMRHLPDVASRPATRRHYAQIIHRVLALAVYPLRVVAVHPLPKGFMPKVGGAPLFPYLYPAEEARLLACQRVPLALRIAHGFSVREGVRAGELAAMNVRDFAFTDDGAGTVTLDVNKTDSPRSWALRPDTARALRAWFKLRGAKPGAAAFPDVNAGRLEDEKLSGRIRAALAAAGVNRRALHSKGTNLRPYRWHDARGSFITIASANGRSEAWIADRTGHTTSTMINRYRKRAREAGELALGDWLDMAAGVPELAPPGSVPPKYRPSGSGGKSGAVQGSPDSSTVSVSSEGRTRTDTPLRAADFESAASAIPPLRRGRARRSLAPSATRREGGRPGRGDLATALGALRWGAPATGYRGRSSAPIAGPRLARKGTSSIARRLRKGAGNESASLDSSAPGGVLAGYSRKKR